jgi:hypothetical protein
VTRKRDEAGLCNVAKGWAGYCIIIIKKPRNLAKNSRMILWLAAGRRPGVTEHCFARSTGKVTKGWATTNALQFLGSEPRINILTIRLFAALIRAECRKLSD